jgi:hypothetical protein
LRTFGYEGEDEDATLLREGWCAKGRPQIDPSRYSSFPRWIPLIKN